ncbi:MAG: CDP-diacylglycerol--glycerol-3-phosphate 3-phosphatidyltransferase [Myxococcales bacterium]|nr:CDP-diacylglycerol--glycerol-3-phosphate 3-phosphatidyltransferase [Myxococcales bacterium]MCB9645554.1 CDP-diacylglycerol--glycerol-3-phosphate 3-phosphatidyltransferase [Deltaproteobacteria bacterium]
MSPAQAAAAGRPRVLRNAFALPNLITYFRILCIPGVLFVMQSDSPRNAFIAAMLFAAASVTDFLDGYLARKMNLISFIGKFLDPLADKLLVTGTLVMLVHLGRANPWVVFIILSREIIITTLRTLAMGEGTVIAARDLGKQKTAFQMVGIWALLVHYPYPLLDLIFDEPVNFHRVGTIFLYISVLFSVLSAADYFWGFVKGVQEKERERKATPPPAAPPAPAPPAPRAHPASSRP